MSFRAIWLAIVLLATGAIAQAQSDWPLDREHLDTEHWQVFQYNYYDKKQGRTYLQLNARYSLEGNREPLNSANRSLYRLQYRLGYERSISKTLFAGGYFQHAFMANNSGVFSVFYLRPYLRNHFKNEKYNFFQLASIDFLKSKQSTLDYNRARFILGLQRNFKLKDEKSLQLVASFEVFKNLMKRDPQIYRRTIEETRLRLEINYNPNPRHQFGLFLMQQTRYYFALAQYDADGVLEKPDRRLNLNNTIIGLSWQINLKRDEPETSN